MQFAGTLTPPAFPREYPYASAGSPHPARACGAPPPPKRGRGQCLRYQGSSRIRGVAGGPPCPALLRDLPVHWTVGISPRGEGLTGRGNSFPLPCLPRSKYLTSPAPPPRLRLRQRIPIHFCRHPPPRPRLRRGIPMQFAGTLTPPAFPREYPYASAGSPRPTRAFGAPPPPPPGGRVRAWRYQGSSRARLFSGISPCTGPW